MLNNLTRSLIIINKDKIETAWLKCLIDDIPKRKHVQFLEKCLMGEIPLITNAQTIQKINKRLSHPQKTINALKSYYMIHQLIHYLKPLTTQKTIEQIQNRDPLDSLLFTIAQNYCLYLQSKEDYFKQIDKIFKMFRSLEVIMIKIDIPIVKAITKQLILDFVDIYKNLVKAFDYHVYSQQLVRATKQLKRFIVLKSYLHWTNEEIKIIQNIKYLEYESNKDSSINEYRIKTHKQETIQQPLIQSYFTPYQNEKIQLMNYDSTRKNSLSVRKARFLTPSTVRSPVIRNTFFVHKESPLGFLQV